MKEPLKWAIDLDGVITANPPALSWFTYHLLKNENNNLIYVVTWRDGSNDQRYKETISDLKMFGISYNQLIMAPKRLKSIKSAAFWKISKINELEIDIWMDDELKNYRRDLGIDLDRLLPDVIKINI